MLMPAESTRTRFLAELDKMIALDPRGAIADMLTVLRERGAVRTLSGSARGDVEHLQHSGFEPYLRRSIGKEILDLLDDEERIAFTSETVEHPNGWRDQHQVTGTLEVVVARTT